MLPKFHHENLFIYWYVVQRDPRQPNIYTYVEMSYIQRVTTSNQRPLPPIRRIPFNFSPIAPRIIFDTLRISWNPCKFFRHVINSKVYGW